MSIAKAIKDTSRKLSNTVVDATENILFIPKSAQELTKRTIEHIEHEEYREVAEILAAEVAKYLKKMNLDSAIFNKKLEEFETTANDMAEEFDNQNYEQGISKLKTLEQFVVRQTDKGGEALKIILDVLELIAQNIKSSTIQAKDSLSQSKHEADTKNLESALKKRFNKLAIK